MCILHNMLGVYMYMLIDIDRYLDMDRYMDRYGRCGCWTKIGQICHNVLCANYLVGELPEQQLAEQHHQ